MNLTQLIAQYFKPKKFEYYRNKTIYDLIGIQLYKKYLPTTGDVARKKRKIIQINISTADKIEELYKYEKKTRTYEWRHILGAIGFILLTFLLDRKLIIYDWILLPILNLYINIYPIFLQRYNRIRIINVLRNNGKTSPFDHLNISNNN